MQQNKIEVNVGGISFTLVTSGEKQKAKEVAEYVDDVIKSVNNSKLTPEMTNILASIQIADELFDCKEKTKFINDKYKKPLENLSKINKQLEEKTNQYEILKKKLDEIKNSSKNSGQTIQKLNERVKQLSIKNESLKRDINQKENDLKTLRELISTLQETNSSLEKDIEELISEDK
ncbi:MAG: cell division protein ZapA [Peptoniphilaceae bacterium]|nr:cell division protein ZapA [Peptoniphilaceae bacterium]MDD7383279.1 cell division protein ZapA [Peptoniphilaceae bacterium]MDY3738350.1 cell division protein ZapA [Peptoniphilaceae bacterium]